MKRKCELKGSYTVEAALLMGILLPLFVALIYMGFFLHDRGFLQGASFETAVCVSLHADEKDLDGDSALQGLIAGRMLGTKGMAVSVASGEKQVEVTCRGNFAVPGMPRIFFGRDGIELGAKTVQSTERPSRKIQMIWGAVKVIHTFGRALE